MNQTVVLIPHDQEGVPDVYFYTFVHDCPKSEFEDRLRIAAGAWLADEGGRAWLAAKGQVDADWTDILMSIPSTFLRDEGLIKVGDDVKLFSAEDRVKPLVLAR